MSQENWNIAYGPGTTSGCSAYITSKRQDGTIEQKAAISMQNLIDLAQFAIPPATSCTLGASQETTLDINRKISNRVLNIQFSYKND